MAYHQSLDLPRLRHRMATNTDVRLLNYSLKIDKAMLKKLEKADRVDPVTYSETAGGLRMYCQTAYFELLKTSLDYVLQFPHILDPDSTMNLRLSRNLSQAKNGSIVTSCYKVTNHGNKMYTINLFHTESSLLINGISHQLFRGKHLTALNTLIGKSMPCGTTLQTYNSELKGVIKEWFSDQAAGRDITDQSCPYCSESLTPSKTIACNICATNTHLSCLKSKSRPIHALKDMKKSDSYTCQLCTFAVTVGSTNGPQIMRAAPPVSPPFSIPTSGQPTLAKVGDQNLTTDRLPLNMGLSLSSNITTASPTSPTSLIATQTRGQPTLPAMDSLLSCQPDTTSVISQRSQSITSPHGPRNVTPQHRPLNVTSPDRPRRVTSHDRPGIVNSPHLGRSSASNILMALPVPTTTFSDNDLNSTSATSADPAQNTPLGATGRSPGMTQLEQNEMTEHLKNVWRKLEQDKTLFEMEVAAREKNFTNREKALKNQERLANDRDNKQKMDKAAVATQEAYIVGLENQLKDLQNAITIYKRQINTMSQTSTPPIHDVSTSSILTNSNQPEMNTNQEDLINQTIPNRTHTNYTTMNQANQNQTNWNQANPNQTIQSHSSYTNMELKIQELKLHHTEQMNNLQSLLFAQLQHVKDQMGCMQSQFREQLSTMQSQMLSHQLHLQSDISSFLRSLHRTPANAHVYSGPHSNQAHQHLPPQWAPAPPPPAYHFLNIQPKQTHTLQDIRQQHQPNHNQRAMSTQLAFAQQREVNATSGHEYHRSNVPYGQRLSKRQQQQAVHNQRAKDTQLAFAQQKELTARYGQGSEGQMNMSMTTHQASTSSSTSGIQHNHVFLSHPSSQLKTTSTSGPRSQNVNSRDSPQNVNSPHGPQSVTSQHRPLTVTSPHNQSPQNVTSPHRPQYVTSPHRPQGVTSAHGPQGVTSQHGPRTVTPECTIPMMNANYPNQLPLAVSNASQTDKFSSSELKSTIIPDNKRENHTQAGEADLRYEETEQQSKSQSEPLIHSFLSSITPEDACLDDFRGTGSDRANE